MYNFRVDIGSRQTPGLPLLTRDPVTSRVRGASVTIPRKGERERRTEISLSLIEGCRGRGTTDVLPHDARGVAVPLPVSLAASGSGGVCARRVAVTDGVARLSLSSSRKGISSETTEHVREMFA
ncbi:unnamed protein product [Lasius platythorax]|uniref:Uncharacterized protein n=1 Tax=Lasius platythorax TaxID=488582 RepID=A0AAV2NRA7_9HYME